MSEQEAFEVRVIEQVAGHAPISLDDLHGLFGGHSWNRLFAAADRLSREGALAIRRVDRGTYVVSLGPRASIPQRDSRLLTSSLSS